MFLLYINNHHLYVGSGLNDQKKYLMPIIIVQQSTITITCLKKACQNQYKTLETICQP